MGGGAQNGRTFGGSRDLKGGPNLNEISHPIIQSNPIPSSHPIQSNTIHPSPWINPHIILNSAFVTTLVWWSYAYACEFWAGLPRTWTKENVLPMKNWIKWCFFGITWLNLVNVCVQNLQINLFPKAFTKTQILVSKY